MNTSQTPDLPFKPAPAAAPAAEPAPADLLRSLNDLRRLFHVSIAIIVVLLAALNVYLLNQVRAVRYHAIEVNRQVVELNQAVQDYETNSAPWMKRFTSELYQFADSHPDFAAMLAPYRKAPATATPTNTLPAPKTLPPPSTRK